MFQTLPFEKPKKEKEEKEASEVREEAQEEEVTKRPESIIWRRLWKVFFFLSLNMASNTNTEPSPVTSRENISVGPMSFITPMAPCPASTFPTPPPFHYFAPSFQTPTGPSTTSQLRTSIPFLGYLVNATTTTILLVTDRLPIPPTPIPITPDTTSLMTGFQAAIAQSMQSTMLQFQSFL